MGLYGVRRVWVGRHEYAGHPLVKKDMVDTDMVETDMDMDMVDKDICLLYTSPSPRDS